MINGEIGKSVYIAGDFEKRTENRLYRAVRELVREVDARRILDLGCSDLVASNALAEDGREIIGVELDISAINATRERNPNRPNSITQADLTRLPFTEGSLAGVDAVLLLDVLEHLSETEALALLKSLRSLIGSDEFQIIVTMPIIDHLSIPFWREYLLMMWAGERPAKGLLDRTHQILTDRRGHLHMFAEAGFEVTKEENTNFFDGVSGEWSDPDIKQLGVTQRSRDAFALLKSLIFTNPFMTESKKVALFAQMSAYQGMYVLRPIKSKN